MYYFPSKEDLVGDVLVAMGRAVQETLAVAFSAPAADHMALVSVAWPVVTTEEADRVFGLFFEASGLAAIGRDPYRSLVPALVEDWIAWAAELLTGPPRRRRAEAAAAVAVIDGLLLLRSSAGADVAEGAARRLGVVSARSA